MPGLTTSHIWLNAASVISCALRISSSSHALARAEGADLLLIRLEHGVQLGIVLRELAVGQIILLKAERLDGFGLDGAVDAQDIAVIAVNHLTVKSGRFFSAASI